MNKRDISQKPGLSAFLERIVALPDFQGIKPVGVNERSILGDTLLHFAARWGDVEVGKLLLEAGAESNFRGELGNTPLHEAVGQKKYEFVKLLLVYGASKEHRNEDNLTPIDLVKMSNDPRLKEIFEYPGIWREYNKRRWYMSDNLTFAELERAAGQDNSTTEGNKWPLEEWYDSVRHRPILQLSVGDLAIACRQGIWIDHIAPVAVEVLKSDPQAGELYDGELAVAMKSISKTFWTQNREISNALKGVIEQAFQEFDEDVQREVKELLSLLACAESGLM